MNLSQILAILRARWIAALTVLGVIVATTVLLSLVLPKSYVATATVVVDVKLDPVTALMTPGAGTPAFLATQIDVVRSERVAQRVVRNLKLTENPGIREQWQSETGGKGSIEQYLVQLFQQSMEVVPSRDSNVLAITYRGRDPQFSAGLANAFVQAYLEVALELRVEPAKQYSAFFELRAKELRTGLEEAQAKLSAFQKSKGIVATDERLDVENARLSELSSQLVGLQTASADSSSRQAQAVAGSADKLQEVLANSVVAGMRSDITRIEARLQELGAKLGDRHPQVVEMRASLAEMRARHDAEVKRIGSSVGVTNTINRAREGQVRAELELQRTKVLRMKEVRDEGYVLIRDLENAQRAYDQVLLRLNQTSLESQATQSNLSVLTPAVAPIEHASPRLLLNTLLSIFVGLLCALATALGLEMFDRRVRSAEDLSLATGLPLLGRLSSESGKKRPRRPAAAAQSAAA